jgi:hypothetical protein
MKIYLKAKMHYTVKQITNNHCCGKVQKLQSDANYDSDYLSKIYVNKLLVFENLCPRLM